MKGDVVALISSKLRLLRPRAPFCTVCAACEVAQCCFAHQCHLFFGIERNAYRHPHAVGAAVGARS